MFEPEVFRKQMYCIEESTCDIVGTFRRPGHCARLVTPLQPASVTLQGRKSRLKAYYSRLTPVSNCHCPKLSAQVDLSIETAHYSTRRSLF